MAVGLLAMGASVTPTAALVESREIAGGRYEASGLVHVPGTNGVLFADDNTSDAVFWMELDGAGVQVGSAVRVPLGVQIPDPEGMTFDGERFYVVGSQSKSKSDGGASIVCFAFDPESRTVSSVERFDGLERLLLAKLPELGRVAGKNGINVEGVAWDPLRKRLLLGLRAPMQGDRALVVPLTLEAGAMRAASPIQLPLGGEAVRAIEYDAASQSFLIVSGASDGERRTTFALWEWSGDESVAPRQARLLDRDLKPEGIARVTSTGYMLVVCDVGKYFRVD